MQYSNMDLLTYTNSSWNDTTYTTTTNDNATLCACSTLNNITINFTSLLLPQLCNESSRNANTCDHDGAFHDDVTTSDDVTGTDDVTAPVYYPWSNPNNVISKRTLIMVETVLLCGMNWVLLVVGSVGNLLSCVVFARQGLSDRMNVSLFSLGLVDFCCVVSWFIMGSSCLVHYATASQPYLAEWWKWTTRKYVRGLHRGFLFSSGCLTMLISVERCLCVLMPLRAPTLVGTCTMTMLIVGTVVVIHLLHLVYPLKFDVVTFFDEATNRALITTKGTELYREHSQFFNYVENVIVMTIVPVVTFSVVVITTIITVVRLMRMVRWREAVAENVTVKNSQVSLVKMLLVVSLIYIITSCPQIILGLVRVFVPAFWRTGDYSNIYQATHLIYLTLGTFNSTVNFFVYYSRSSRFRAQLRQILPCCASSVAAAAVKANHAASSAPPLQSLRASHNWDRTTTAITAVTNPQAPLVLSQKVSKAPEGMDRF